MLRVVRAWELQRKSLTPLRDNSIYAKYSSLKMVGRKFCFWKQNKERFAKVGEKGWRKEKESICIL